MKVALIVRSTLFTAKGGDTVQVVQTAGHLGRYGVRADIKLANERIDYNSYHLLHFFNLTRPADILPHSLRTKVPYVVSPVLVNYSGYDRYHRKGLAGSLFRLLPANGIEYVKTIARWLTGSDKRVPLSYLWKGQWRSMRQIVQRCALLLPNSGLEQLQVGRLCDQPRPYQVIPNGVDIARFPVHTGLVKDPLLVLCVGRIEGIKNQLNLIKALNNTPYRLVLIGAPAPNQLAYYEACRAIAGPNITFIDHLPQAELRPYYERARVHVLPSWFETCGLSSLEAAAMGCNIVITDKGYTREYYEDYAFYCDPASPTSIKQAVDNAAGKPYPEGLRNKIVHHYTWQIAAEKTAAAYRQVVPGI